MPTITTTTITISSYNSQYLCHSVTLRKHFHVLIYTDYILTDLTLNKIIQVFVQFLLNLS